MEWVTWSDRIRVLSKSTVICSTGLELLVFLEVNLECF